MVGVSLYCDFSEDDAGISFRYAAHLFDGKGLVYNPGERVEGYSNFGYVVLLGAVYKIMSLFNDDARLFMVLAAKIVNLVASLATLWLCFLFGRNILKQESWKAFLAPLLVACNGAFLINTASPLETATYTAWLMLLTYLVAGLTVQPGQSTSRRHAVACVTVALLFSLWRIDAPILLGGCCVAFGILRGLRLQRRDMAMFFAWLVPFAGYTLFRYCYFGQWMNNPYYAKISTQFTTPIQSQYTNVYFTHLGDNAYLFLLLFALAVATDYRKWLLPGLLVMVQWIYVAHVGGDWMTGFRFWAPLTPHICILLVAAIDRPFSGVAPIWERMIKTILAIALAAWWFGSGIAVYQLGGRRPGRIWVDPRACSVVKLNPYWETVQWIRMNVPADALLVVSEGGYIPLLTGLRAIDTYGLCNRELAAMEGTRSRLGLKLHWTPEDPGTRYILSRNPDIIVLGPGREARPNLLDRFDHAATCDGSMQIYLRRVE